VNSTVNSLNESSEVTCGLYCTQSDKSELHELQTRLS